MSVGTTRHDEGNWMIAVGERMPNVTLRTKVGDKVEEISTDAYFKGKRVVLFGVPGAFTQTCSLTHMPGYIENYDALLDKGVDKVAVVSVNDAHVMKAWSETTGGAGKIDFLADAAGELAKALGLENETAAMGLRFKRFSMLVEDGIVKSLNLEQLPGVVTNSGAAHMLEILSAA